MFEKKKQRSAKGRWRLLSEISSALTHPSHHDEEVKQHSNTLDGGTGLHDSDDEVADGGKEVPNREVENHDADQNVLVKESKEGDSDDEFFDASSSNLSPNVGEEQEDLHGELPSHALGDIYYGR